MAFDNQIGFGGIFASGPGAECANCDELRAEDVRIADVVPGRDDGASAMLNRKMNETRICV